MPITLPYQYQNATTRNADLTQQMLDLYNVVAQINAFNYASSDNPSFTGTITHAFTAGTTAYALSRNVSGTLFPLFSIKNAGSDAVLGSNTNIVLNCDSDGDSVSTDRNVIFQNRGVESARISSTNNLLLGSAVDAGAWKLQVTGDALFTDALMSMALISSTGTNNAELRFTNTGGSYYLGAENSTGTAYGATAYAMIRYCNSGRVIQDIIGGTGVITTTSPTGFAVSLVGAGFSTKEGANAKQGTAILVAGTVTVANTSVTASSRIFLTSQVDGGTPGFLRVSTRVAATSFTITSSNVADTSTVAYEIFEPG
jgi:hypothetical protein